MCVHPSWQLLLFQLFQFNYYCFGSTWFDPCIISLYICTVHWFNEHLHSKLVLCVCPLYIPYL